MTQLTGNMRTYLAFSLLLIVTVFAGLVGFRSGLANLPGQPWWARFTPVLWEVDRAESRRLQVDASPAGSVPTPDIRFENLSVEDGLSTEIIYSIWQDSLGFLWIGTYSGLHRYDGDQFKIYEHDPLDPNSLSNNIIFTVYEDHQGELWVGTFGGGLNRFDRQNDQFIRYQHDPDDPDSLGENIIYSILEDSSGNLWIATYGGGLDRYDRQNDRFIHYQHSDDDPGSISSDYVSRLYEDRSGALWVGTAVGLNLFDRQTETFTRYLHDPENPHSLGYDVIVAILEDQQGDLWVGTANGLDRLDRATGQFTHYRQDPEDPSSLSLNHVNALLEDSNGMIWVGTNGAGLNVVDAEQEVPPDRQHFMHFQSDPDDPYSLTDNYVNMLYQDRAGTIWIATLSKLCKYDRERGKFQPFPIPNADTASAAKDIYSIYEDSTSTLWIGASDGLRAINPQTNQATHYRQYPDNPNSLNDNWVFSIYEDSFGVLWLGTAFGGIDRLDRRTGRFSHYQRAYAGAVTWSEDQILRIYQDRSYTLWFGTGAGLTRYDPTTDTFSHYYISPSETDRRAKDSIYAVLEDHSGTLWVGTSDHGLLTFDRQSETFISLPSDPAIPEYLRVGNIPDLYEDEQNRLWIATIGQGLYQYDPANNTYAHYDSENGLADNQVIDILQDQGAGLWLVTRIGVSRFDPLTGQFENFDVSDAQQRNIYPFMGVLRKNGQIILAGEHTLLSFQPQEITLNPRKPPIVMTAFRSGKEFLESITAPELLQQTMLVWPDNDFEFEFAALNFTHPEKNQYAYKLEGYDEDWIYTGARRFGRYTNLPGGKYTLRLKGSNNEGIWNENGIAIAITVVPPFWQTRWFQVAMLLILAAATLAVYRFRVRGIEASRRELERQVASRTKELAIVNTIAGVVSSSLDLREILYGALDKTLDLMQIEAGGIYLLENESGLLKIFAHKGMDATLLREIDNLKIGEGYSGQVVLTGQPLVVEDLSTDPRLTRSAVKEKGWRSAAITPLVSRGEVMGSLFVLTSSRREFTQQDLGLLASISSQIAIATENARLFSDEVLRAEQFRVIAEVGRRLTLILDVDELLWQLVRTIQQAFGYYHVGIGLIEGDEVVYQYGAGELWDRPDFVFKPARLKVGQEGVSGWVAANGEPLLVSDVTHDPRYVWMQGSTTRAELTVPILVKGKVIGVLDTQSDQPNAFDETDLVVLQSLAHQAGAAIENAQLYKQSKQLAVMEERSRLARDLHDAVTQTLFSASLVAEALPTAWEKDAEEGKLLLQELRALSRGALAEMRTLLLELRPAALVETRLEDLLRQLGEAAGGREGIPVDLSFEGQAQLPQDVHIALYRIAQEALNNVVKHARANHISIRLCFLEDLDEDLSVLLSISDDGRGFDPTQVPHHRLGLGIMHERAQAIGASLTIQSQPGEGAQVTVSWKHSPREEPQEEAE
ncbi:MAG: two-component regulator propeller domain-containing protein [Chloroflexota bacterium]